VTDDATRTDSTRPLPAVVERITLTAARLAPILTSNRSDPADVVVCTSPFGGPVVASTESTTGVATAGCAGQCPSITEMSLDLLCGMYACAGYAAMRLSTFPAPAAA
jgi:hypothetical protein